MDQATRILKTVFGYDAFISLQADVIQNVLRKKDTLVVMPTGGGKSLCYQIPALIFEGLTIVVSPLISLMKDQVTQLEELGVPAALLHSALPPAQYRRNVEGIKTGAVKLLYLAPETLLKANMLVLLASIRVDCLAIDEAHCISSWGHDFRPEYRRLVEAYRYFPRAVCIALTATATPRVREDIKTSLDFEASNEFVAGFDRPNLLIRVNPKEEPFDQTLRFLEKYPNESGIIYCFSRKQVDDLSMALNAEGFSAASYHAGMAEADRDRNQDLFIRDDVQIMVATIAFGMGIDKSNIRFVIHYDMPRNIDSYYQEIGRAGRDGLPAECLLLFSYADIRKIRFLIDQKRGHEKRVAGIHLSAMLRLIEADVCRRIPLLDYFGEQYSQQECRMCDNCLSEKTEKVNLTIAAQKFLSCVKRTGERFGGGHIIDVLRGSRSQKVLNFGHDRLSTYGIGQEYSKAQWRQLSRQFLNQGLMSLDMEYGRLYLTPKAWEVFRGEQSVWGRLSEEQKPEPLSGEETRNASPDYDRNLFEMLREKRKQLAEESGLPPYAIFSDRTLAEMAAFFPQSKERLLSIYGIGEIKSETYGALFLEIICSYCSAHQIEEREKKIAIAFKDNARSLQKKRHMVIGEAFNAGRTVDSLIAEFGIKRSTVLGHLFKYLREGNALCSDDILKLSSLSPSQQKKVAEAFKTIGMQRLRPVFDVFDGEIRYEELNIIGMYCLSRQMVIEF